MPNITEVDRLIHVYEVQQFGRLGRSFLEGEVFSHANTIREMRDAMGYPQTLTGKTVTILLYESTVRSRLAFEAAIKRLGGDYSTVQNAGQGSSSIAETPEDMVRVISNITDAIIIRSDQEGVAKKVAAVSSVPIINGGERGGQHPIQAIGDTATIYNHFGQQIDGLHVVMAGDLIGSRTAESVSYLLGMFSKVRIDFVSPLEFRIKPGIIDYLEHHGISTTQDKDLEDAVSGADVLYMSGGLGDRFEMALRTGRNKKFVVNEDVLKTLPAHAIIMHPLPRGSELPLKVDNDNRVVYFAEQPQNGILVKMAVLEILLT